MMYIFPVILGWLSFLYLIYCYIKKKRPNTILLVSLILIFIAAFYIWGYYLR